jgi:DNA invertase Pin-like site-specific DNA recombinase
VSNFLDRFSKYTLVTNVIEFLSVVAEMCHEDRQTHRKTGRKAGRQAGKEAGRQAGRHAGRQA